MIPIEQIRTQREVEDIYQRHVDMVYQICIMFMKTIPDAEDVTQTVFRKVMEYRKPFRDIEHEKAWLIVTAQNECKNQLRHWWRTKRASEETYQKTDMERISTGRIMGMRSILAREISNGTLSPLLSRVYHIGNLSNLESKSFYGSYMAGKSQI